MKVSVVGLGKVGCVMAALYASRGHEVLGIDVNEGLLARLSSGETPYIEPDLDSLLGEARGRLRFSHPGDDAVLGSDVISVIVPTPSHADGTYDHSHVKAVMRDIAQTLPEFSKPPLIVLASTVTPQASVKEIIPILEEVSGLRVDEGFHYIYSPQFIALGSVVANLSSPDLVLVGASSPVAAAIYADFQRSIVPEGTPLKVMAPTSAEITKIAINTFVTMKISFANMIGEIADASVGADAYDILDAVGADTRIGSAYLKPALGYGGPCFPRDNAALAAFALSVNVNAPIGLAADEVNDRQPDKIIQEVKAVAAPGACVAVLGLSYKPSTPVTEQSQSVAIANLLVDSGFRAKAFDPLVRPGMCASLRPQVEHVEDLEDILSRSDVVVVATPWEGLASDLHSLERAPIIDPWRIMGRPQMRGNSIA